MIYSKKIILSLLILVVSLPQNDAQGVRGRVHGGHYLRASSTATEDKYDRTANAHTVNVIGGGRHSHVRYTEKTRSSSTEESSARAPVVDSHAKLLTISRPKVPSQVETTPSKKKSQKMSSRKAVLSFENPVQKTALTMKQRD
ncbi:unnamed protein product [Cylindrotheca closterium]|uniref:Secreted protein n=1 Tax=Cylindrotheca closterium TaxID=2856 RepID=A0AAD2CQ05_9STRA|nr:unnamed protein product [Cylindrotheca closterium]